MVGCGMFRPAAGAPRGSWLDEGSRRDEWLTRGDDEGAPQAGERPSRKCLVTRCSSAAVQGVAEQSSAAQDQVDFRRAQHRVVVLAEGGDGACG